MDKQYLLNTLQLHSLSIFKFQFLILNQIEYYPLPN